MYEDKLVESCIFSLINNRVFEKPEAIFFVVMSFIFLNHVNLSRPFCRSLSLFDRIVDRIISHSFVREKYNIIHIIERLYSVFI